MKIQRGSATRTFLAGLVGCALAVPALGLAQGRISEIIIFGDSLSDTGNAFALQKVNNTPPNFSVDPLLIPDDAYARGGHHFTNGATWAEDFARPLGLAADVSPAFRDSDPRATNYAVGGARASDDGTCQSPNLPCQVQVFLEDFDGTAPAEALYVIEIGGNDLRDVLATGNPGLIATAIGSVSANIVTLYEAGARKFLVWNAPDIGLTPAVRGLGPVAVGAAGAAAAGYNTVLEGVLANLKALPGINITEFDLYGALYAIVADPPAFGLADVTDACISPNDPPFVCKNPDTYLFWDGIHPTKAVHALLAQDVAQSIK
jgi:phospholipase/lecithinase/hemolysin